MGARGGCTEPFGRGVTGKVVTSTLYARAVIRRERTPPLTIGFTNRFADYRVAHYSDSESNALCTTSNRMKSQTDCNTLITTGTEKHNNNKLSIWNGHKINTRTRPQNHFS